jgi:hypothetical protein
MRRIVSMLAAGLAVAAGVALAAPAQADIVYNMTRAQKVCYVANLIDLGVNVTPDTVEPLVAAGYNVCYQFVRDDRPGWYPMDYLTKYMYLSKMDASAVVVVAVDMMCPEAEYKLHSF